MRKFLMTTAAVAILSLPAFAYAQDSGSSAGGSNASSSRGGSTAGAGSAGSTGGGTDTGSTAGGTQDAESRGGSTAGPNAVGVGTDTDAGAPQDLSDPRCVGTTATTDASCTDAQQ